VIYSLDRYLLRVNPELALLSSRDQKKCWRGAVRQMLRRDRRAALTVVLTLVMLFVATLVWMTAGYSVLSRFPGTELWIPVALILPATILGLVLGMYVILIRLSRPYVVAEAKRLHPMVFCPRCAYPIGTSPVCTECGNTLHTQHVSTGAP
jgi:hypothetical protein